MELYPIYYSQVLYNTPLTRKRESGRYGLSTDTSLLRRDRYLNIITFPFNGDFNILSIIKGCLSFIEAVSKVLSHFYNFTGGSFLELFVNNLCDKWAS
mgnify:CR=1 FL=1